MLKRPCSQSANQLKCLIKMIKIFFFEAFVINFIIGIKLDDNEN